MKFAFIIDDYLPHSTRVGAKMFHELAQEFIQRGHSVTVITPDANLQHALQEDMLEGVTVWRFRTGPIKDISHIQRAVNESLLSVRAWRAVRHKIKANSFDGVVYYSPSVFWGYLVRKIKQRCACKSYLILRDFFPQWAIDAGMIKQGSLTEKYFRHFEKSLYDEASDIGLMSENNLRLFMQHNPHRKAGVLRNWASIEPARAGDSGYNSIINASGLQNKTVFFYGGNIGHAQDMANLMRLVRSMQAFPQAHFLFVGQGDEVTLINRLAQEWALTNFTYLPSVDQKTFKYLLTEVDVGLFSLAANHTSHNFPGKLLGYMVQSIPILGSVNEGNDLADIVNANKAGTIFINGEDERLLQAAINFTQDEALRKEMGAAAYQLLLDQFSVGAAAGQIENAFRVNNESH